MTSRDKMRDLALACFRAGVAAADPARAVEAALDARPEFLTTSGRLLLVAIGKGAGPMMRAAIDRATPDQALLLTNYENATEIAGCRSLASGHPTPDQAGLDAAAEIIERLEGLADGDRAVLLLSGGGSALAPAPIEGVSFADKVAMNGLLLECGAPIDEINSVRKRLSRLKGGGFARHAAPASVGALILSDVPHDDLASVASGPTVANPDPPDRAKVILRRRGVWERAPASVRAALAAPVETSAAAPADNVLIGGNSLSVTAMATPLPALLPVETAPDWLDGDVSDAAARIAGEIRRAAAHGPRALLWGGETTVQVRGDGKGGRNQELALRVARALTAEPPARDWVFLSAGTDGRDGPTDAAGGLVDAGSLGRIRAAGADLDAELSRNNAYAALSAAGDLLITGATGTNVADLQVALLG